jgi:hypothetical protein
MGIAIATNVNHFVEPGSVNVGSIVVGRYPAHFGQRVENLFEPE